MIQASIDVWLGVSFILPSPDQNSVMPFISYLSLCKSPKKNIWRLLTEYFGTSQVLQAVVFYFSLIVIFPFVLIVMSTGMPVS